MQVQKDEINKLMEKLNIKLPVEDRDLEGKALMKVHICFMHCVANIIILGNHASLVASW
jgi:hypothetical protein